jgi:hypothetical protein
MSRREQLQNTVARDETGTTGHQNVITGHGSSPDLQVAVHPSFFDALPGNQCRADTGSDTPTLGA